MRKKTTALFLSISIFLMFSTSAYAAGRLFWADYYNDTIVELDPDTGAALNTIPSPISYDEGCVGLAFGSGRLFVSVCGSDIYELNSVSGAVVNTITIPPAINDSDGLGFSGTELYVLDYEAGQIHVLNPDTGALIRTLNPGVSLIGGLSYAGGRNSLFVTDADEEGATIYEINALTGAIINSFAPPSPDIYGVGYSFERGTLFLGDVEMQQGILSAVPDERASAGYPRNLRMDEDGHTIYEVNPNNGAVIGSLPISPVWALASDEAGLSGPSAPIPTMNEWGVIIFMGLAGILAVFYIRRTRTSS